MAEFWEADQLAAVDPSAQFGPPARPGEIRIDIGGPKQSENFWENDAPVRTAAQSVGRQLGLTGRAVMTGITSVPTMFGDAANSAINLGSQALGSNFRMRMPSEVMQSGMTAAGVPEPNGVLERIAQVGGSALAGAGGAGALGSAVQGGQFAPAIKAFADAPIVQTAGALAGAGATETAKASGVENPYALMAIGALGGVGGGASGTTAARGLGGVRQAARPFSQPGRDVIVGKALNRVATTPEATAGRLGAAQEIVPGSKPTVGQVSGDPGLMGAEPAMRGMDSRNLIGNRLTEQNKARQQSLYEVAGDESTVTAAKEAQKSAYKEYAVPAFKAKQPVSWGSTATDNPVLSAIDGVRKGPKGARKTVRDAMDEAEAMLTQDGVDLTDAETLYAIREDLALARDGKLLGKGKSGAELANLKQAKNQLSTVISALDDQIETGAPGFKEYLKVYHQRSIPLDQLRSAQALRARAETAIMARAGDDATPVLGDRFGKIFRDNLDKGLNLRGKGPKAGNLTPSQIQTLRNVADDIDRGAAAQAKGIRVTGSDTFKNLSVGSVIGRILGDQTGELVANNSGVKTAIAPISFLYRIPDQQMEQLIIEAWLDPQLAARLMRKATDHEIQSVAKELADRAGRQAAASSLYAAE